MGPRMSEDEVYRLAKKRVEARKDFAIHLVVYVGVNALLICLWLFVTGRGFPWFVFPLGGWGIGLIAHYFGVYGSSRATDNRVAIEKEAEKIRREEP